jgi:hypothetical protein
LETRKIAIKKTWSSILIGSVLLTTATLQAEPSVDVDATVVSTYIFRGADFHQGKFTQDGEKISSFNVAPAFQPSINFNLDNGMFFNVWTSYALVGREDVDTDGLYQTGPGQSGAGAGVNPLSATQAQIDAVTAAGLPTVTTAANGTSSIPGFYSESNGLRQFDEVDLTLGYEVESSVGTMSGGIIAYVLPNTSSRFSAVGADQFTEFFVGFAPSFLPGVGITYYAEVNGDGSEGTTYTYIDYGYDIDLGGDQSLGLGVGAGYQTLNGYQNWRNVDAGVSYSIGGFSIGLNAVYRPDLSFFDGDAGNRFAQSWINGGSNGFDGQVADPSQTVGFANSYVNSLVSAALDPTGGYTYTPRQKLPRVVYFVSVGYSTSF